VYSKAFAYPILLYNSIDYATQKKKFFKIKNYKKLLEDKDGQEILSNLAYLSIESGLWNNLDFSDLINPLDMSKVRKTDFVWVMNL
jgi:hypothetical protein